MKGEEWLGRNGMCLNTNCTGSAKGVISQIGRIILHLDHLHNHMCKRCMKCCLNHPGQSPLATSKALLYWGLTVGKNNKGFYIYNFLALVGNPRVRAKL